MALAMVPSAAPAPAWDDSVPLRETQESGAKSCSRMPAVRVALPLPLGIPRTPRWAHDSPFAAVLKASLSPPVETDICGPPLLCQLSASALFPESSSPPCSWVAQLHQGPIQLKHHPWTVYPPLPPSQKWELRFPSSHSAWAMEARVSEGLSPLLPSLAGLPPAALSGCITPLQASPTTGSVSPGLCTRCALLPGTRLPWLHFLKTSSDITSFESPL